MSYYASLCLENVVTKVDAKDFVPHRAVRGTEEASDATGYYSQSGVAGLAFGQGHESNDAYVLIYTRNRLGLSPV